MILKKILANKNKHWLDFKFLSGIDLVIVGGTGTNTNEWTRRSFQNTNNNHISNSKLFLKKNCLKKLFIS